jgi:hypothetical protein
VSVREHLAELDLAVAVEVGLRRDEVGARPQSIPSVRL